MSGRTFMPCVCVLIAGMLGTSAIFAQTPAAQGTSASQVSEPPNPQLKPNPLEALRKFESAADEEYQLGSGGKIQQLVAADPGLASMKTSLNAYLASAAVPPLHAARDKVFGNGFVVLLAGLVFALGGAMVAYNMDSRVQLERRDLPDCLRNSKETTAAPQAQETTEFVVSSPAPQAERTETRIPMAEFVHRPMRGREAVDPIANCGETESENSKPSAEICPAVAELSAPPEPATAPASMSEATSKLEQIAPAPLPENTAGEESDRIRNFRWADMLPTFAEATESESQTRERTVAEVPAPVAQPEPAPQPTSTELSLAVVGADASPADVPYSAVSRLGGLRNLMTSQGIKNLHKEAEYRKANSESEPQSEWLSERSVFAQPDLPVELANGRRPTRIAEVKAAPEIIPPRGTNDTVEHEREKELTRPVKSPPVSQWETTDEVQTLPSKRGQYRRRR